MQRRMILLFAIAASSLFATTARAQVPGFPGAPPFGGGLGVIGRPTVSPYLNIMRGGDPAINYYGLVRPQVAFSRAFQALDNNVVALQADVNQPSQTGQRSSFMTQGRYFMNTGTGGPARQPQPIQTTQRPPSRGR